MQDNKASKMFLIVAVVLGVLATILAFFFINDTAGKDRGPKAKIVVAARDMRPIDSAADGRGRLANLAVAFVMPGTPAEKFAVHVGDDDRQLDVERRNLIFKVDRVAFVGPEKHFEHVFQP